MFWARRLADIAPPITPPPGHILAIMCSTVAGKKTSRESTASLLISPEMDEYRVNLDIYNGPLDLLLYLIRRDEVDIYDIPLARITEQYIKYVELLKTFDPNLAGEFLVLAATLMEIKTRMLLPTAAPEEGGEGVEIDPRAELVRQLLEYKAFKDASIDLRSAYELQSQKYARKAPPELADEPGELDLEEVQVWNLFDAFNNLLTAIGADGRSEEIIYDDTPIELHATDIMDRLSNEGSMRFSMIFEGRTARSEIIGLFLALLELIRRRQIMVQQGGNFDEIHIHLNPNPPTDDAPPQDESQEDIEVTEQAGQKDSSGVSGRFEPVAAAPEDSSNVQGYDTTDSDPEGQKDRDDAQSRRDNQTVGD